MDYNTFVEMINGQEKLSFSDAKRMYIEASKETDDSYIQIDRQIKTGIITKKVKYIWKII